MEKLFYALWAVSSLAFGGLAALALWQQPGLENLFALALVVYYAFCFFRLIGAVYLPWGLLGRHRRGGFWLCLILLPVALLPLHAGYAYWLGGGYPIAEAGAAAAWPQLLLDWLQDGLGYLGPLLLLGASGVGMAILLLRLLRGQVVR